MYSRKLTHDAYTIAWVCVLDCELNAARALLDEVHEPLDPARHDDNLYLLGRSGKHNIVVTFPGQYGTTSAAHAVTNLVRTFPNIRFGLMVGVGGAIPNPHDPMEDIRLGDVVVSEPSGNHGGVLNYDMGKWKDENKLSVESHLNKPPTILLNAIKYARLNQRFGGGSMRRYMEEALDLLNGLPDVIDPSFPGREEDLLFKADYQHVGDSHSCGGCDRTHIINRRHRTSNSPVVHYGLIASGNAVMRNALQRDKMREAWNVLCFEMEAAGLMNHFPCIVIRGLCDYSDSHKNKRWQPYAAAVAAAYAKDLLRVVGPEQIENADVATTLMKDVARTLSHVDRSVQEIRKTIDHNYRQKVLDWLSPIDHDSGQSDFFSQHQTGTGKWFLESNEFRRWVEEPKQSLLCQGIPGTGKTVMASLIVHHLHTLSHEGNVGIAHIYCNFRQRHAKMFPHILSSLLKQLSQQQPQLPEFVTEAYERFWVHHIYPSPEKLLQMLGMVMTFYQKVFIVVDALDEIDSSYGTCREFLSSIFRLQKTTPFSFIATSRPVANITSMFRRNGSHFLEIRALDDDIRSYIEGQLDKLRPFVSEDPEMRLRVKETIVKAVDGLFLLARFHLDFLRDKLTRGEVISALGSLPKGSDVYDQIYHESMFRIQGQTENLKDLGMRTLGWIICAERPLTISELKHALAVKNMMDVLDEDAIPDINVIVEACCGLVAVDEKRDGIHLIHFTAQEYLERKWRIWFPGAHSDIATACLTYLDVSKEDMSKKAEDFAVRQAKWPLYGYAVKYWLHHARLQTCDNPVPLSLFKSQAWVSLFDKHLTPRCGCGNPRPCFPGPNQATGVHLAVYLGLGAAVRMLIEQGMECDRADKWGRTPLTWASEHGNLEVAQILLEKGANPNHLDSHSATPLIGAVIFRHQRMVELLLQRGAMPDFKSGPGWKSPLELAVSLNLQSMVNTFLEHGAATYSPDTVNEETWNVIVQRKSHQGAMLLAAARDGRKSEVERLLDLGVNADYRDEPWGRSPISQAAEYGQASVVVLLLERGVNPNSRDTKGYNPTQNNTGKTPLMWAAMKGHTDICKILLKYGGDPTITERDGRNSLSWSAEWGRKTVVSLLLNNGAQPNVQDRFRHQTPLSWAAMKGHATVVELLLQSGADPGIKDKHGRSALDYARENNRTDVLDILQTREIHDG